MLTATDILATPPSGAAALFARAGGFRGLAQAWHPDHNRAPEAGDVLRHLIRLRDAAARAEGRPAPRAGVERRFRSADGRAYAMRALASRPIDAGEVLVGAGSLAYVVPDDLADLADRAASWRPAYADDRMRGEMERFLPAPLADARTVSGRVLTYRRTQDQILLADLMGHAGALDPVHAAWVASGLMNLCCWLEWAGLSHGAIGPDVLLVSPRHHSVALTGPALFATRIGARPAALPERTLSTVPRAGLDGAAAGIGTDLELARATVREALGDPAGARLLAGGAVPKPFALWLTTPPAASAKEDYAGWERARGVAFGRRRFVEWKVSGPDVYGA